MANRPQYHPQRNLIVTNDDGEARVEEAPEVLPSRRIGPASAMQKAEAARVREERRLAGERAALALRSKGATRRRRA